MATLTFVIGATATGKTFFIQQNFNQRDVKILNVYDYQQKVYDEEGIVDLIPFGMQFRCLMRANTLLLKDIVEELTKGRDVVMKWYQIGDKDF